MVKHTLSALAIGRNHNLLWMLPSLLARAGFCVDVITSSPLMKQDRLVRNCTQIPHDQSILPAIAESLKKNYDWFIVAEDGLLLEIAESSLPLTDKLKLLPVQKEENFIHLYSKIGLSKLLSAQGVATPPFSIAKNKEEAALGARQLGYPVLLKRDASGGGIGIMECHALSDLNSIKSQFFDKPLLVQKKISGIELDLSAIYQEGNLIHFNYAKVEKTCYQFGPSSLRTYHSLSTVEEQVFHELAHIGKILGAHGFTNISCIQSEEGRFYIEVDMRPNVWVEFPRFLGEDPSTRIAKWFSRKEKLSYPVASSPNHPSQILLPYFLRLNPFELLVNRYNVWKFIPKDDVKLVIRLLKNYFLINKVTDRLIFIVKTIVPKKFHKRLRELWHSLLYK